MASWNLTRTSVSVLRYPWGHLLPLLHHRSSSGDCAAWQKISSNREQKTVMLVILHYTGEGDPFITTIHTNHNTKNICNIWGDLSATHVIKTVCHFNVVNCVVNVTLAHYIKKKKILLFLTLHDLPSLPHSPPPFSIFFRLLAIILTFIQLTWYIFFNYKDEWGKYQLSR